MAKNTPLEKQLSSGNVFADIGVADAEEHLIKAGLVVQDRSNNPSTWFDADCGGRGYGHRSAQGLGNAGRLVSRLLRRAADAFPGGAWARRGHCCDGQKRGQAELRVA